MSSPELLPAASEPVETPWGSIAILVFFTMMALLLAVIIVATHSEEMFAFWLALYGAAVLVLGMLAAYGPFRRSR